MIAQIIEALEALDGLKGASKGRQILMNAIGNLAQRGDTVAEGYLRGHMLEGKHGKEGIQVALWHIIAIATRGMDPETLQVIALLQCDPPRPWPRRIFG